MVVLVSILGTSLHALPATPRIWSCRAILVTKYYIYGSPMEGAGPDAARHALHIMDVGSDGIAILALQPFNQVICQMPCSTEKLTIRKLHASPLCLHLTQARATMPLYMPHALFLYNIKTIWLGFSDITRTFGVTVSNVGMVLLATLLYRASPKDDSSFCLHTGRWLVSIMAAGPCMAILPLLVLLWGDIAKFSSRFPETASLAVPCRNVHTQHHSNLPAPRRKYAMEWWKSTLDPYAVDCQWRHS